MNRFWYINWGNGQLEFTDLGVKVIVGISVVVIAYFASGLPILLALFMSLYSCLVVLLILSFGQRILPRQTFIPIFLTAIAGLNLLSQEPLNNEFYLLQASVAFSQPKSLQNFDIPCLQKRSFYGELEKKFLSDSTFHSHVLFGPKGSGKSTFLELFANNKAGIYYHSLHYEDLDNHHPFQNLVNSIFFHINGNPISWIWRYSFLILWPKPTFEQMIDFFADITIAKKLQSILGRKPIFIIDDVNLIKKGETEKASLNILLRFLKVAADKKTFHVILSGNEGKLLDENYDY